MTAEEIIDILKEDGHINNMQQGILRRAIHNTRGQWNEIVEPFGWDDIKSAQCSACGESYPYPTDCGFDDIVEMFKYCPECGAKMEAGTRWKEEEDQP